VAAVVAGEAAIPSTLLPRLLSEWRRPQPAEGTGLRPIRSPLTARAWEVLDLLCDGCSTLEIAATLDVSVETVRSHVKYVLRKLGVNSRAAAVEQAQRLRAAPQEAATLDPG
jgi:DNA-binding NarL/FixJ family response regulator